MNTAVIRDFRGDGEMSDCVYPFFSAKLLIPVISDSMLNDFMACGGILVFVTGFRITKIREFRMDSMLGAMILVMQVCWLWSGLVALPLG